MNKALCDMTLEELCILFPIFLTENRSYWKNWFVGEATRIAAFLPLTDTKLSHIGSTAISGIMAKPIIDILLEIPKEASMQAAKVALTENGYNCMCEEAFRMDFCRGYTEKGFAERVFHLHMRFYGDNDELYFRDYMNEHHDLAKQYEELKLKLWKKYEHNRDAYTNAKGEFIRKYTQEAKVEYGKRYLSDFER